jgi:predicted outer membrane repeat protein
LGAGTYTENLTVDKALTFVGEGAASTFVDGGGTDRVFTMTAEVSLADLTIQNGRTLDGGGGISTTFPLTLTSMAVMSNTAVGAVGANANGGGIFAAGPVVIINTTFTANDGGTDYGGAIYSQGSSLTLTNATFAGNRSGTGGAIYKDNGSLAITNSSFLGNRAISGQGGALYNDTVSDPVITNAIFSGNWSNGPGGAMYNQNSNPLLTNVTFSGNLSPYNPGGAIANSDSTVQLVNGVLWGNSAGTNGNIPGHQIFGGNVVISHTLVQSGTNDFLAVNLTTGPGVITTNPLFAAAVAASAAPTTTGNYRLQTGSPAIDSGDNNAISLPTDLDGNPRIQNGTVNMGAYETPVPALPCAATRDAGITIYFSAAAAAVQQAVDAASPGDTVKIAGACTGVQAIGGFTQTVDVAKALTLQGGYTATNWTTTYPITQPTTLDALSGGRVISATAPLAVTALTLQHGAAADYGGGIRTNSPLTLTNVTVYSNTAQLGGGVYAEGASIYAASMVVTGSQFLSNTAANGMGGGLMFFGHLTVAESRFDGNHAEWGRGGGIYATGPFTLTGVTFTNNSVAQSGATGGAVYAGPGPATGIIATMTNITVTGNSAFDGGGGIGLGSFGRVMILGGHFEANRCTANSCSGGALTLSDRPATIAATRFISNEAGYQGGGLYTSGAITITQGLFERNVLRQSGGMGGGMAAGGTSVTAVVSDTHFVSNTAGTGGGVRFFGPTQLIGGAFDDNTGGAVYAARSLVITPTLPYTYTGDFTLESTLSATGGLTFTTGTVAFWGSGATHYLTNAAPTTFDRLNVFAQSGVSVLDVGTSVVNVTGIFTNAGVIHRLAPTQTVALDETYVYTDGVGQPTVLLRQTGGAAMGDTFVRVSANLATNNFVCNGTPLSPQAVRRYFDINSGGDDSGVTADLTLRYHAPANPFFTEANNTTADSVVIYHCDGTRWVVLDGSYTRGVEGDYRWVKLSGYTFTSFSPFVLGDPPSTDANLADLALDAGTLTPTFDWATVAYTASVANSAASIRVTAIVSDDTAALQINSLAATSGVQSDPIPLIVGANVITTFVTAQDGVTTKTYTVTVTRAPSSNAELAGLALSSGPLTPSFDPATTGYTASVSYTPASIDVTAITSDTTATLALNGAPITSGAAEPVVLAVGENLITVTVTAQDGVTSLSYIITATRAAPATNAQLGGLELDGAVLSPAFISTTTSYTSEVTNLVTGLTITPTVNEGTATVTVNGTPAPSGAPFTVSDLAVGQTVITLVVTAEDGVTQQSYTITVTRLGADGDWYVDPMGDNANNCHTPGVGYACQTILGAMNKSLSGDRIFIAAATYTESLVVTKSLQFIGVGGPLVSGGGTNRVFSVTAGVDVTMDGLTVTRGWLSGSTAADGAGAGIYNSGNLTLTTTVITNNVASSAFVNTGGGGIYNAAPGVLRLFGSSVISNAGYQGGGLHVAGGTVMLDHSSVFSNVVTNAMAAGGGLYIAGAATAVTVTNNSTIAGNRAAGTSNTGGGVHVAAGVLNVISSTVTNNVVNGLGGGFYLYPGVSANVTASTVFSNAAGTASNHNGGGIYSLGAVTLTNSTVTNNRAGGYGGGVYQFGNGLTIAGSAITSNTATYSGGGFYMAASAAAQALLTDSVVASNTANSGAGVYAVAQMTLTVAGGSVHNNTSNTDGGGLYAAGALTLTDVSVYSNQANGGRGGGIYVGGAATLAGGALYRNSSTSGGGGLYAAQALRLSNVDVLSNTTDNYGPSNIGYGGGVYAAGAATLTGGRVQNNRCIHETCAGGGVYLDYTGALVATDTQFLENRAGGGGGAGLNLSGVATLTGVQIISNTATPDGSGNGGSGAGIKASAALTLTNATVLSNTGNLDGGGLYVDAATVITGGSYQGNRCNHAQCSGGAVYVDGPLTLRNANISNNRSSLNGGGVSVYGVATVVDTTLSENTAAAGPGGGLNVAGVSNSLVMTNTQVLSNTSSASGGGVYAGDTARIAGGRFQNNACTGASCTGGGLHAVGVATIDAVRFIRNAAQTSGGALYLNGGAEQIVNTLLDSNSAPQGAGLYDNFGGTTILLTTVASPTVGAGSAIQIAAGTVAITDSIVASYTTGIAAGGTGALQGDYNLVYNAPTTLDIGPNSLTDDPRFRDPAAGNYRLLAASPAVGAGAPVSATTDIDGAPRPQGSGYDLGAHQVNLVWYVDPDGSDGNTCVFAGAANACKTITGALGKAQIGSTIYITTGVYTERLTVTVPIQFVGTGADAAAVVVDGGGAGRVFNVTASDATFSGLTIQNGAAASGAGIRATGNLSMTNVAVLTNTATQDGGGIFASSALTLTDVEVRGASPTQRAATAAASTPAWRRRSPT